MLFSHTSPHPTSYDASQLGRAAEVLCRICSAQLFSRSLLHSKGDMNREHKNTVSALAEGQPEHRCVWWGGVYVTSDL